MAALLILLSLSVSGCSSAQERQPRRLASARRSAMEPPAVGESEEPADEVSGEPDPEERGPAKPPAKLAREEGGAQAGETEEPAEESSAPADRPAPAREKKVTADEMIRLMGLDRESRKTEAAELVKMARTDRTNLDADLAEERLEKATTLDPENEEARRLLAELRTIRADRRGTIPQVANDIVAEKRVAIRQAQAEVRNALNAGDRHYELKEFDAAVRDYEKAIQLVRGFPFNLQIDEELQAAEKSLERAKDSKKRQDEEDRLALEQRMKETRESEQKTSVNLLQTRVRELRRKARDAWDRQEYAMVEEITSQILTVLPEDEAATALLSEARAERHLQTQHNISLRFFENHQNVLLGLDESAITYQKIFRYPTGKEWQRLQPKVITIEERAASEETVVEKDIRRQLELPQTIEFAEKTPLMDALKLLNQISGVNFILSKEAREAVKSEDIKVQLPKVTQTPLKSILNLILANAGDKNFQYTIKSGAVLIGSKEDLKGEIKMYTVFYSINDVTQPHPDYPAPKLALDEKAGQATGGGGLDVGDAGDEENKPGILEIQKLIDLITKELKDQNDELVGAEPKVQNNKLMVKTTLANHQKVQRLLAQLRKATGIMVTVESRFLVIQENFLEEIGVDMGNASNTFLPNSIPNIDGSGTSIDPGYEFTNVEQDFNFRAATIGGFSNPLGSKANPFNVTSSGGGAYQLNIFDAEKFQLEAILTGVGKEQSIRKLNSPRVTAFNTQVAHTLVINQAAYIQDLEVNQTGVIPVINPVIGILNFGSILEVRPTVSYDRKYVVLEIQPTLAERLQSEFALLNLSGNFTSVPVELPVLSVTKIKTTVTIPDGGTVLVGGLKKSIKNESSIGIPGLRRIPILNLLFGRKGESNLRANLFVLINAKITVVQEEEERVFNT